MVEKDEKYKSSNKQINESTDKQKGLEAEGPISEAEIDPVNDALPGVCNFIQVFISLIKPS